MMTKRTTSINVKKNILLITKPHSSKPTMKRYLDDVG